MKKFFLILTLGLAACMGLTSYPAAAYAATVYDDTLFFEKTYVMKDLRDSKIDGQDFDLEEYRPTDPEYRTLSVLYLAEYCYSPVIAEQENFGLYVYIYNPQRLPYDTKSSLNSIELAIGDRDAVGFEKYPLYHLSTSTDPGFEGVFYKFKVFLSKAQKKEILQNLDPDQRRYEISGLELKLPGEIYPTDVEVGKVYTYTGSGKGVTADGNDAPLQSSTTFSDVLSIDALYQTYYSPTAYTIDSRYNSKDFATLYSVYFAIPQKYFSDGFELTEVRMEWLRAYTEWGLLTGNEKVYNELLPWVGVKDGIVTWSQLSGYNHSASGPTADHYSDDDSRRFPTLYAFSNGKVSYNLPNNHSSLQYLPILLPTSSFASNIADSEIVPWETLQNYMRSYHDTFDHDRDYYWEDFPKQVIENGQIRDPKPSEKGAIVSFRTPYGGEYVTVGGTTYPYSRALFRRVDRAKTVMDIRSTTGYVVRGATISKEWWSGVNSDDAEEHTNFADVFDGAEAIHILDESDVMTDAQTAAQNLLISDSDYSDLKKFYTEASQQDQKVALVHFDTGYYYVSEVNEGTTVGDGILSTGGFDDFDTNARTFSMQVNLGVDVLHLKFESGEKSFTIGVVATPIDVGRDITPDPEAKPDGNWMWWCIIAGAIVIVLMIADGILENKAGGTIL